MTSQVLILGATCRYFAESLDQKDALGLLTAVLPYSIVSLLQHKTLKLCRYTYETQKQEANLQVDVLMRCNLLGSGAPDKEGV
jgi:hypothetical protein